MKSEGRGRVRGSEKKKERKERTDVVQREPQSKDSNQSKLIQNGYRAKCEMGVVVRVEMSTAT